MTSRYEQEKRKRQQEGSRYRTNLCLVDSRIEMLWWQRGPSFYRHFCSVSALCIGKIPFRQT